MLITRGEAIAGDGAWTPAALERLLQRVTAGDQPPVQGVIYCWALDGDARVCDTGGDAAGAGEAGCRAVVRLVRALADAASARHPRLWLVTRAAQALPGDTGGRDLAASMLWGLGRVVALEHPELWGAIIDLEGSEPACEAELLAADLRGSTGEDQIAYRGGQRWVPRLDDAQEPAAVQPVVFRPDACYLITGGLTGLGLETARWMARQGARRLLLVGRTELPPRRLWRDVPAEHPAASRIAAVRELEALGATVYPVAADVADAAQLAAVLESHARESATPIRGVVHSAAVLRDQLLLRSDEQSFDLVLRTKAAGAWNLHSLTRDMPLDFFVLFSSMTALVGQFGQAAYAAGNAFLDALAHHRRAAGLAALAINWGPWAEIGLVARGLPAGDVQLPGARWIAPEEGMRALARLIAGDAAQVAVIDADWNAMPEMPLLSTLAAPAPTQAAAERPRLELLELLEAPRPEREALVAEALRAEAARVLRIDPARLSLGHPLTSFGMDSIMAVELRTRIQTRYRVKLSLVQVFTAPLAQLAAHVAELIEDDEVFRALLAEVEQLSEEQASLLLTAGGAPAERRG